MNIVPKMGFYNIRFGLSKEEASKLIGRKGTPDNYDADKELMYFDNGNLSLMFTKKQGLISIYILDSEEYRDVELWELKIFYLKAEDIINILTEKGLRFKKSEYLFNDLDIVVENEGIIFNFTENNLEAIEIYNCENEEIHTQIELQDN